MDDNDVHTIRGHMLAAENKLANIRVGHMSPAHQGMFGDALQQIRNAVAHLDKVAPIEDEQKIDQQHQAEGLLRDAKLEDGDTRSLPSDDPRVPKDAEGKRLDGPTVAEFVAAGYPADKYPPGGYAKKSTDDEIQAAITAQAGGGGIQPMTSAPPPNINI